MRYHLMGIGGIGMSALARILNERGYDVSGSDSCPSAITKALQAEGIQLLNQPPKDALTVFSSAIPKNQQRGIHRSVLLAQLLNQQRLLAVGGTHGKTTTSAMLTHVLKENKLAPSFAIGGLLNGKNGGHGAGEYFVAEADESDGSMLNYHPFAAILLNGDLDHVDFWKSEEHLLAAYREFGERATHLIYNSADFSFPIGKSYGFKENDNYQILSIEQRGELLHIQLKNHAFTVRAIGEHNASNATAVFALCQELGIDPSPLSTFPGVARRQEIVKEQGGVLYIDDYAHHPKEVSATLRALKTAYPDRRLIALFQPHRYTRLAHFFEAFQTAFEDADLTLITKPYAAGEDSIPNLNLAEAIDAISIDDLSTVRSHLRVGDLLITMGAGDITHYSRQPLKIALLYGGKSPEHDISVRSAYCIAESLEHDIVHVPVAKDGTFDPSLLSSCDIAFPVFHGPNGEDGLYAGYLEALGIPHVGCHFRSSSVCMDKVWAKQIAHSDGISVAPFTFLKKGQAYTGNLQFPVWVKAARLGSSLGAYKVDHPDQLQAAIDQAFTFDDRLIIEEHTPGRELEVAVLGDLVAGPGEILLNGKPYLFELKYDPTTPTTPKAELPQTAIDKIHAVSKRLFDLFDCTGWCRFDFLYHESKGLFFSEANPIPGCTPTSLYPQMCATLGISYAKMLEHLIDLGLRRALV